MDFLSTCAECTSSDAKANAAQAAQSIRDSVGSFAATSVLYFASPDTYDPETLAAEMHAAFPDCTTFGCSSAGELHDANLIWKSVAAMAFTENVFATLAVASAEHLDAGPHTVVESLFAEVERQTGRPMRELDAQKYIGFVLMDGLAKHNSAALDRMSDLTSILHVGGFASDERRFTRTVVYHNGRALKNGVVYALMQPRGKWDVLKTQSVTPTGKSMVATKIDAATNTIVEFDGKPAIRVYAEAMGMAPEDIPDDLWVGDSGRSSVNQYTGAEGGTPAEKQALPDVFINWPLGVQAGEEPFLRDAITVTPGGGLEMYLPPLEGMRFHLYRTTDIVADTRGAIETMRRELGGFKALVCVNCLLREIQVLSDSQSNAFASIFAGFPFLGFSSYGEVYACPVNQSAVMLAFA